MASENQTVATQMVPSDKLISTHPDAEAWAVIERMGRDGLTELPVVEDSKVVGIILPGGSDSLFENLTEIACVREATGLSSIQKERTKAHFWFIGVEGERET